MWPIPYLLQSLNDRAFSLSIISGMALSKRFEGLRKRSDDGQANIDPDFLHKKIYVSSQMAPRHSWGGTATTQTKIDVRDEELESIKGNLAYRFKAAKAMYARAEDTSVEPLARDER